MDQPPRRYRFPRSARLRTRADFDRVFQARRRASSHLLVLYTDNNHLSAVRLGVAVGRRFGNAVRRNRIKRLLREAFRRLRPDLPSGTDWVVVPQAAGADADYAEISAALTRLSQELVRRRSRGGAP